MSLERCVLLVSPGCQLTKGPAIALSRAGYRVVVARSFESAKAQLTSHPDVLITDLKLGEFNGLQLALRSRASGIPALVVADSSFEQEIEQLGAIWISPEVVASGELESVVQQLLQSAPLLERSAAWFDASTIDSVDLDVLLNSPTAPVLH
jgi:CheY-like chemotaxis protein